MQPVFKYIFLVLLTSPVGLTGNTQLFSDHHFKFKTYTTSEGLAHNSVKKCISDSKGFLWIITENGLSRFDGYQFKNYRHIYNDSTSLPKNDIFDIAIDKIDRIFLAYKTGFCLMEASTGKFTAIKKDDIDVEAVGIVFNKSNNLIYIATQNGLLKYDVASKQFQPTSLTKKINFPDNIALLFFPHTHQSLILLKKCGEPLKTE